MELWLKGAVTTLIVDEFEVHHSRASKKRPFTTPTNSSDSPLVFIGGVPLVYGAKLSLLSLPSVVFEPRFRGFIRHLQYAVCGSSGQGERELLSPHMVHAVGVRRNAWNACERRSPCLNNGQCVSSDHHYICDCSATNYAGRHCETGEIKHMHEICDLLKS